MSPKPRHRGIVAVIAVAASAVLLAGCATTPAQSSGSATAAGSDKPVNVAFSWLPNGEYAGNFVADDAGYYAQGGIKANFIPGGPNSPAPEVQLASGQADIAYDSNSARLFSYLAKANDVVVIGRVFQTSPSGLLSLAARPVRKVSELTGARIIAPAANRSSMQALMTINGLTNWTFVPGGADIGALQAGQGDALVAFATSQPLTLEAQGKKQGKDYYFTDFSKLNYYLLSEAILVKRSFLAQHRDLVVNYLKATAKGWEKANQDPKAAADLVVNKYATTYGFTVDQQERVIQSQIPYIADGNTKKHGLFWLDTNYVTDKVYPSLKAGGVSVPDPAKAIDTTVQQDAQK